MNRKKRFVTVVVLLATVVVALGAEGAFADSGHTPPIAVTPQPLAKFRGIVKRRPEGTKIGIWEIGEHTVRVTESTRFDETEGPAEVGAYVLVLAKHVAVTDPTEVALEAILIRVLPPTSEHPITIRGRVTELETTYLVVNGRRILYDRSTQIIGHLEVGAFVKIRAIRTPQGLKALTIEVLPVDERIVEFEGVIEYIGHPTWVIGGRRVTVARRAVIIGWPEVGSMAKVRALVKSNGELLALLIQVQNEEPGEVEWTGIIERLPPNIAVDPPQYVGRWVVGGRSVWVTPQTEITGTPWIGRVAHVVALRYPRRPLVAKTIHILNVEPVERPPPTPTVTAVP